jgi:hypothetical protein
MAQMVPPITMSTASAFKKGLNPAMPSEWKTVAKIINPPTTTPISVERSMLTSFLISVLRLFVDSE